MEALTRAHDYARSIGTASLVAIQHGRMIDSWGEIDRRLELHSVRKSLLSALIGIAVAQRKIDLDASLGSLGIDDVPPVLTCRPGASGPTVTTDSMSSSTR